MKLCSMSTWLRFVRSCPEFIDKKKRSDMCEICVAFDKRVAPSINTWVSDRMRPLIQRIPGCEEYWSLLPPTDPSSTTALQDAVEFIGNRKKDSAFRRLLEVQPLDELCTAEDQACAKLIKYRKLTAWWETHSQTAQRQHGHALHLRSDGLMKGHVYWQLDYMQTPTVPLGPVETSGYWYATGRRSMSCLCVVRMLRDEAGEVQTTFYVILSSVIEKTTRWTLELMRFVTSLDKVPGTMSRCDFFFDRGTHFLAYEVLTWCCVDFTISHNCVSGFHTFAEHHGKGPCDGLASRVQGWIAEWCKKKVIENEDDFVNAVSAGASGRVDQHDRYVVRHFEPTDIKHQKTRLHSTSDHSPRCYGQPCLEHNAWVRVTCFFKVSTKLLQCQHQVSLAMVC